MAFTHPFQKICQVERGNIRTLLGATGSKIFSLDLQNGSLKCVWSVEELPENGHTVEANGGTSDQEPPTKKQKRESVEEDGSRDASIPTNAVAEKSKKKSEQKPKPPPPNVSHLISTKDGKHVIAITGEDKCVRVFELQEDGALKALSQRCMPKRPCAIVLTPDESNLLVGDKFGDVYTLPLHPSDRRPKKAAKPAPAPFVPSASELTVHTKGNLDALRQQQKQKLTTKTKTGPDFEHQLILGHVSMLTDLLAVESTQTSEEAKPRNYILTSDRDEHIRVSRGIPQAHIIENYCLRHTEFVSKLCVLPWERDFLVSGSGEPSLKCYSWPTGKLLYDAFATGDEFNQLAELKPSIDGKAPKFVVSGLWAMQYVPPRNEASNLANDFGFVIVALEGLPVLFTYSKSLNKPLSHHATIRLPANVLDVAIVPMERSIVVSLDTVHSPGSVKYARTESESSPPAFVAYTLGSSAAGSDFELEGISSMKWVESPQLVEGINNAVSGSGKLLPVDVSKWETKASSIKAAGESKSSSSSRDKIYSPLGELLYSLENLRKRAFEDRQSQEKDDEAEVNLGEDSQPTPSA